MYYSSEDLCVLKNGIGRGGPLLQGLLRDLTMPVTMVLVADTLIKSPEVHVIF